VTAARVPWTTGMVPEEALIPPPAPAPPPPPAAPAIRGRARKRTESTETVRYPSEPPAAKKASRAASARAVAKDETVKPVPSDLPPPRAKAKAKAKAIAAAPTADVAARTEAYAKARAQAIPTPILPIATAKKVKQKPKVTLNAGKLAGGIGKDPDDDVPLIQIGQPRGRPRKVPSAPPPRKKVVIRKVTIASQKGDGPSVKRRGRPPGSLGKAKRSVMVQQNLLGELGF